MQERALIWYENIYAHCFTYQVNVICYNFHYVIFKKKKIFEKRKKQEEDLVEHMFYTLSVAFLEVFIQ